MSCEIFNKPLIQDADFSTANIDLRFLRSLIGSYSSSKSGLWQPLVVTPNNSSTSYCELLSYPLSENVSAFNPCNCSNDQIFGIYYDVLENNVQDISTECDYCSSFAQTDCCDLDNNCDVRFNKDDYTPKIPYLQQGYISGFTDFKHLKQFPSCSNLALGKEKFITLTSSTFKDYSNQPHNIYIDWKLQETISEVPYDAYNSRHINEYNHNKSYIKSKIKSNTCGNFILKSSTEFPGEFIKPYGFTNQTYDNIYVNTEKLGSHWKWNYQSGILGWYRYFDINRSNDDRPIAGIDLYIPPGDVFWAKNDGPEPSNITTTEELNPISPSQSDSVKACPSGLKLVNGQIYNGIIPNNSEFIYISENIYDKFLEYRQRLELLGYGDTDKTEIAAQLATAPEYDNVVTDLLDNSVSEDRNSLGQLSTLNQYMTSGTEFKSFGNINYCNTTIDLINTLASKYGCYMMIDPNSNGSVKVNTSIGNSFYADLDFDMVIPRNKLSFNSANGTMLPNQPNYLKNFRYDQTINAGNKNIASSSFNSYKGFDEECVNGSYAEVNGANYCSLYFYGEEVSNIVNNSGSYYFRDEYQRSFGSIVRERKYPASAFNPHIDLIAAHPQGGIHCNAIPFGLDQKTFFIKNQSLSSSNRLDIKFDTKDCAIKIYAIKIGKLQNSNTDNKECLRFPYKEEDTCKCYGFDIIERQFTNNSNAKTIYSSNKYLPNLSTNNSPTLKRYGGYSQSYLDSLFGAGSVSAGGTVSNLSSKIDPLQPYGCEKSANISLFNYINTYWSIQLNNMSTNHSDIFVRVDENVDLTGRRFLGDPSDEDYGDNDNLAWKRFTTKVTLNNDINLHNKQETIIFKNNNTISQNIDIKLQNPFLSTLINDTTGVYISDYVSDREDIGGARNEANLCSLISQIYSRRGDESSIVNLTFTQRPRKQLLNFNIPSPRIYGTLTRGEFHPNFGLKTGNSTNNPISDNRPSYEYSIFGNTFNTNKGILYGNINANIKNLFNSVSNFELHKKLRLYIKIQGKWYTLKTPNRGSYTLNSKKYIGKPKIFEYLREQTKTKNIPLIFPLPPKYLFPWNFYINHSKFTNISVANDTESSYPFINGRDFIVSGDRELKFEGSRYYFMVDESITISQPSTTEEDEDGNAAVIPITTINDISKVTNSFPNGSIVDFGGDKYFYIGGATNDISNYLFLGNNYQNLIKTKHNLEIEYDKKVLSGYIYNSGKDCNHYIKIFDNNRGNIVTVNNNYIIKKKLILEGYDDKKRRTFRNPVYYKIFTEFTLAHNLNINSDGNPKVFGLDIANINNSTSFCIFNNSNNTDYSVFLRNNFIKTKWSDVLGFNNSNIDESIVEDYLDQTLFYGSSVYDNWFYKQIVNNFDNTYKFKLLIDGSTYTINSDQVSHCILQKYNINKDSEYINLANYKNYHNFIPIMDINIHDKNIFSEIDITETSIGNPISGIIYSPNWLSEYSSNHSWGSYIDPDSNEKFWINIENDDYIVPAYIPNTTYSETLRLDGPTYWLDSTISSTNKSTAGVRTTFEPIGVNSVSSTNQTLVGFSHSTKTRETPFATFPIYGDGDDNNECGEQDSTTCFLSNRGQKSLTAKYKLASSSFSASLPSICEYFFTYDGGLYNGFGQANVIGITRTELDPDNPIDSYYDSCNSNYLRPKFGRTFLDPELQNEINKNFNINHADIVNKTDSYANQMLFRIMYGEDDKINRQMLNSDNKILTADDLVNYTDPEIKAVDIYDQILYNYDKNANYNNFLLNGSFSVVGPTSVGTKYKFKIGDKNIEFTITRIDGIIYASFTEPYVTNVQLYKEYYYSKNITIADREASLLDTEDTTYELLGRSNPVNSISYQSWARRFYTGKCVAFEPGNAAGWLWAHYNPGLWQENCTALPENFIYDRIPITNCKTGFCSLNVNTITFAHKIVNHNNDDNVCLEDICADYQYGYCRRGVDGCELSECKNDIKYNEFIYNFEQCRTNFNLYGHYYKSYYNSEMAQNFTSQQPQEEDTNVNVEEECPEYQICTPNYNVIKFKMRYREGYRPDISYLSRGDFFINRGLISNPDDGSNIVFFSNRFYYALNPCYAESPDELKTNRNINEKITSNLYDENDPLRAPCLDHDDNSTTADPGDDLCGYIRRENILPGRSYWIKSTKIFNESYNPQCVSTICSINYNNKNTTININSETICIDNEMFGCPLLSAELPAHSYVINENIESRCSDCYDDSMVEMEKQQQNFQTIRFRHREYLNSMTVTDLNNAAMVKTYYPDPYNINQGFFRSYYTDAHWIDINTHLWSVENPCGQPTRIWYAAKKYRDARGMALASINEFKRLISQIFEDNNGEGDINGSYYYYHDTLTHINYEPDTDYSDLFLTSFIFGVPAFANVDNSNCTRTRRLCSSNNHISSDDIIRGIVPGSCSQIQFETTETPYTKYRLSIDGNSIESDTEINYTVKSYIEYDYIRPVTIQDKLKETTSCHPVNIREDEFPRWYAEKLGLNVYTQSPFFGVYYNNFQNRFPGTDNYLFVNAHYQKTETCENTISCYYNTDDTYPNYPFGGAPCAFEDFNCWGSARDWRKVWETNPNTQWS